MKKTYIIEGLRGYKMNIGSKSVEFRSSNILRPCCFFRTCDEELQSKLEDTRKFKTGQINVYSVAESSSDKVAEETMEIKDNMQVKSMTSAINILVTKYGADEESLKTIDDVVAKARACGLRFVKLEEKYAESRTTDSEKE